MPLRCKADMLKSLLFVWWKGMCMDGVHGAGNNYCLYHYVCSRNDRNESVMQCNKGISNADMLGQNEGILICSTNLLIKLAQLFHRSNLT